MRVRPPDHHFCHLQLWDIDKWGASLASGGLLGNDSSADGESAGHSPEDDLDRDFDSPLSTPAPVELALNPIKNQVIASASLSVAPSSAQARAIVAQADGREISEPPKAVL